MPARLQLIGAARHGPPPAVHHSQCFLVARERIRNVLMDSVAFALLDGVHVPPFPGRCYDALRLAGAAVMDFRLKLCRSHPALEPLPLELRVRPGDLASNSRWGASACFLMFSLLAAFSFEFCDLRSGLVFGSPAGRK